MKDFIAVTLGVYLSVSIIPFIGGLLQGSHKYDTYPCQGRLTRIEYIFPAHALGCWLSERRE